MEKTDQEIIKSYLAGEQKSFEYLVSRYVHHTYNFVRRLYNNEHDARDITQEVFIKVWKSIHKYNPNQNFKTWLFTIARNTTIDWLRKRKEQVFSDLNPNDDEDFEDTLVDNEPLPDAIFAQKELRINLESFLNILPIDQKTIILLHIIEDMTFDEISLILEKPLNTIKSYYRRGITRLRESLESAPNIVK